MRNTINKRLILSTMLYSIVGGTYAQAADDSVLNLSLDQLSEIEVTSVSKKAEKAKDAPAAIYVITQEDIRRSGMTKLPELFRMVPGMSVAQAGSNGWAISERGFNDKFANKALVLIDGRTVYSPMFSGVLWDAQDVVLEDIERIEVIRGPGATLWGANAVNGVINIITKSAKDTQGSMAVAGTGTLDRANTVLRHGMKVGEDTYVRTYAKYNNTDELRSQAGDGAQDEWHKEQAGFRADSKLNATDDLTVQGDVYHALENNLYYLPDLTAGALVTPAQVDVQVSGANLLMRYNTNLSNQSALTFQAYYDGTDRKIISYNNHTDTLDFDLQHVWTGFTDQEIVSGLGYRLIADSNKYTYYYTLTDLDRNDQLFSAFVQDKIALADDIFLTLGSKFEHNDYTGFEYQPSARMSWLINEDRMMWGSVARAIRTPNRFSETGLLKAAAGGGGYLVSHPNPNLESEQLIAYEMGYRFKPTQNTSVDSSVFYNDYSNVAIGSLGAAYAVVDPLLGVIGQRDLDASNNNAARSFGIEIDGKMDISQNWQLAAGYSYIDLKFAHPSTGFTFEGKEPRNQFNVRSTYKLMDNVEMSNALYYVDNLRGINVKSYPRFDTRLGWNPMPNLELSLTGTNLLRDQHQEFNGFVYQGTAEVPRAVYANATLKF